MGTLPRKSKLWLVSPRPRSSLMPFPPRHTASVLMVKNIFSVDIIGIFETMNFYFLNLTVHPVLLLYFISPDMHYLTCCLRCQLHRINFLWFCIWHSLSALTPLFSIQSCFMISCFQLLTLLTTCTVWNTCCWPPQYHIPDCLPVSLATHFHLLYNILFDFDS